MNLARDTAGSKTPLVAPSPTISSVQMQQIAKRYGTTVALDAVDFELQAGEIHALLGENGAGKSTLMHVLSGMTQPDAGTVRINNVSVHIGSPREARRLGIAMVHQHFTLVPAFTVQENLALDADISLHTLRYRAEEAAKPALNQAAALGWQLDPHARVEDLPVGIQQRIEIAKALATNAQWLIFDEPTAVLIGEEIEELFRVLRALRDSGKGIVFITHKLPEVMAIADRVTVLRRGHKVATAPIHQVHPALLAQWMVGEAPATQRAPESHSISRPLHTKTPAFRAENLTVLGDKGEKVLENISFEVYPGEIFGVGGVDGNGQTELAETLVGLRSPQSGQLFWYEGAFQPGHSPRIGYIPQDRRRHGLALTMTVEENLLFEAVKEAKYRIGPFLRRAALHDLAETLIREFDIRTPSAKLPASALSGGNQQKIVVARALHHRAEWIVAVNPVRGLDINATQFVHTQLLNAKQRGASIVLISTDLDELAALADRTVILSNRQMHPIDLTQRDATQIGLLLGGAFTKEAP
ncbi:nucleoside ABC transporter ATP-binding protein [Chthonomonas calidirosea]|uniref:Nucleoside ABC transporter ATP-binding protein n=1 Tax=Chthonomonas calidirosea (strain DSM 23976 / ICMP 18418 / T49) TaxID=1303518 RepID=S0EW92_CHTCT|nr:ABC transporter ATP-binding protein [Chthonomonas calidirosea]CCW33933.1 nucleoside ABC transporter ATP-binding protein [Chthonomonas calidirosea T49]CEK16242.1 nucleoside ABC transporter ATP-binding protein [Chthonomonas calidirosea]